MATTSSTSSKGGFFHRLRSIARPSATTSTKSIPTSPPPPPLPHHPRSSVSQPTTSTRRPPKSDPTPIPPTRRKTLFGPIPTHSRDHATDGYIPVQREQRAAALRAVGLKPVMTMSEMEKEMDELYARVVPDPTSSRNGRRGRGEARGREAGEGDEEEESESQRIREAWLTRNSGEQAREGVMVETVVEEDHDARSTPSCSQKDNTLFPPTEPHVHSEEDLTVVQPPKPLPPVPITPSSEPTRKPSQKAEVHTWSTSPSSYSPPSAWNRDRHVDTLTVSPELIASGSSESTCSDRDIPQTPMSPGAHTDVARVRRSSSSRSRETADGEVDPVGESFGLTVVKEVIVENPDDAADAGLEFGQLPVSPVETKEQEEVKPQPRPQKTQPSSPVVERRSGIFGTRHRSSNNKPTQSQLLALPPLPPSQPRPKRSFASLTSKLSFRPKSLFIDTSSSTLSPQSPEEKAVISGVEATDGVRLRPRPRHAHTVGSRPTAIVSPTSLTMHNRASMAIMAETIEDAEMRRLTEAAFLDF
ncbi:hypothetical protein BDY19DRAFT_904514 [Irpex rosettiformis]|uniref:Uncharacterized protein n=1 Tax=Irpex rosettiformis TaxID=378272 RepID=A0ACB8U9D1_9APHY|nr:hypothetical protein BDY19DRAFT_904514 [Irpex rosettiformis]